MINRTCLPPRSKTKHHTIPSFVLAALMITAALSLAACGGTTTPSTDNQLQVVATTSIVADVVQQVGGDFVNVTTLMPPGSDPHEYSPRPQDVVTLANTEIVFANGAGLEEFLEPLLESAGASEKLVEVSAGIDLLSFEEEHLEESEEQHEHDKDPHTWMDPNNVVTWVANIEAALASADPAHAADYRANAEAYQAALNELDAWIRSEVEQIPIENRLIISDHAVLGYLADEYGFTQLGTITGSFSTEAAPSAQELAALEDQIIAQGVKVIFVSEASNQKMADQIAQDTGIQVVVLYLASLSDTSGPAPTYLDFMRFDISAMVAALK